MYAVRGILKARLETQYNDNALRRIVLEKRFRLPLHGQLQTLTVGGK